MWILAERGATIARGAAKRATRRICADRETDISTDADLLVTRYRESLSGIGSEDPSKGAEESRGSIKNRNVTIFCYLICRLPCQFFLLSQRRRQTAAIMKGLAFRKLSRTCECALYAIAFLLITLSALHSLSQNSTFAKSSHLINPA